MEDYALSGGREPCSPDGCPACVSPATRATLAVIAAVAVVLGVGGTIRPWAATPSLAGGDPPPRGRLLWLDGRPTVSGPGVVVARDSAGRVLLVDEALRVREAPLPGGVASVVSAAPAPDDGLWIVESQGRMLRLTAAGTVAAEISTPYAVSTLGGAGSDGLLAVARSAEGFPFVLDTLPEVPVVLLDTTGHPVERLGRAAQPQQPLLSDLANAGHVLRLGDRIVYAPFVRDEVIAFGPGGDTAWTFERGLAHETPEPRFVVRDGRPVLDYFPVNLGLGLGPDGRLYVLSTADTSLARSRLDALDPATGELLSTFELPTVFPTIIVTRRGRIHVVSSGALLGRARAADRPPVPGFDWPRLGDGRVTEGDLRGRVTIVNAWASWCAPCREEMPALVALWRSLADSGLSLLAVNEDVRSEDARRWLAENRLDPPVALARGKARHTLGYPGLPYTLLIDREGRIAEKWIGYLGPRQIGAIEAAARRELGLAAAGHGDSGSHHHHAMPGS